jgi:hypothetical protein
MPVPDLSAGVAKEPGQDADGTTMRAGEGEHMSEVERRPATELPEMCCNRCGQTFIPADRSDPLHFQRRDGELCGGTGQPFRPFVIRRQNRR